MNHHPMDKIIADAVDRVGAEGTGHAEGKYMQLASMDWLAQRIEHSLNGKTWKNKVVDKSGGVAAGGGIGATLVLLAEKLLGG